MSFFGRTEQGKIADFRAKYPEYDDLDDQTLADALYEKSYSDLDRDEFMGVFLSKEIPPAWNQKEAPEMDWNREDDQFPQRDLEKPEEISPFQETETPGLSMVQNGQKYDINREGYESDEAATDAFLKDENEPLSITKADTESEDLLLQPEADSERSYTQQYNDETVAQGKQRENEDGTTTTVLSKTGTLNGKWYNVPGFDRETGKDYESDDAAIEAARADIEAGKVTAYETSEEAVSAATEEHKELEGPEEYTPPTDLSDFGVTDEQLNAPAKKPFEAPPEEPPEPPSPEELAALGFVRNTMDNGYEPGWWSGTARSTLGTAAAAGSGFYKLAADALDNVNTLYNMAAKEDSDILTGARDWLSDEGSKAQIQSIYNRMIADYSTPENAWLKMASQGVRAIPDMAAVIATTALTRNPNAGYAVMGAQVFSDTYGRSRYQDEKSIQHAFYDASAATAYELGGEKAFKVLEPIAAGMRGGKQLLMTAFNEGLSEMATEGLTIADELTRGGKPFEGVARTLLRVGEAGVIGTIPGAGMHMGGNVIQRINNKMNGYGFNTDQGISDTEFEKYVKDQEQWLKDNPNSEVLNLEWSQTTEGAEPLDLGLDTPIEELPTLEEQDPREVIRRSSHKNLMNNPAYKRFYNASDLGELSAPHEERVKQAKEAYIRKAEKIKKWKPIVEETTGKEADFEIELTGEEAATQERQAFEKKKAVEPTLPDGYDPSEEMFTNIDGEETGYTIGEAARVLEEFDRRARPDTDEISITVTDADGSTMVHKITREERDQLEVQLDEYRMKFDEEETVDSPRSEEREAREIIIPSDPVWGSTVEEVDPKSLTLNPDLMQYKSGTDETGRNKQLEGVTQFDASKAGIILAWEDVNGKRVVADGHQRVNLLNELQAKGLEQDTKILTRVYREDQGFTAKDVRTIAAEINIAQGTGTALDAAKVIRDFTEQESAELIKRLPANSSLVRDAIGLSKLGDEAFQVVVNELIEPKYGSMIGNAFEESEQTAAMQILIKSKPSTFAEAYAMIADIQAGGFVKSEQGGLFGEVEMESLIKERAQILGASEAKLKKNVTVFNALTKEEKRIESAGNVLDTETNKAIAKEAGSIIDRALRTINTNPELNNELNRIAKDFKSGTITKAEAANQFVEAAKSYTDRSSGKLADKPGDEKSETKEKPEVKTKKKPSQITLKEEVQIEETGEVVEVSENAAQALLKLDRRISVLKQLKDCVLS